jgi:transposase
LLLLDRSQSKTRTIQEIAEAAMVSPETVSNLKRRYFEGGITGALYDRPRPGAKRKVDREVEARLIALTCSDPPEGYERWTLRLLADELVALEVVESISHVTVREVLKNKLQQWQVKSWCIPKASARFVAKMEDVLAVYQQPYDPKRPQVCLDEISTALHSTPRGCYHCNLDSPGERTTSIGGMAPVPLSWPWSH